ncbi:MAG: HlyC/CorC family transporter, partial [Acidobacteria bacterium]|nr:HlyC/CorC family transporter [Acidobacteriota bacterium]
PSRTLVIYFILLGFSLLLSLFFSASETAFMTVDRLRLKYQAEAGDKAAQAVRGIVSRPERLLGVILLGNNVSNIAAASIVTLLVTTYAPRGYVEKGSVAASALLTLFILIFCELTPKVIAASQPEMLTRRLLSPLRLSIWLLSPFARLAALLADRLVRLVGMSSSVNPFAHALSEEEIRAIIESSASATIAEERKEMLSNVFQIGATRVRGVMIPRMEVTAAEVDTPIADILALVRKTNYSRIPIYRGNFDNILGILNVKDLLQYLQDPGEIDLSALLRPAHFVPDTARLDSVLREFQSMHLHMAVVVDEFGGVEGIVTLEDLLEEIVGEIRDEHDTETDSVRELAPNLFAVTGNLPVKDFNRFFETKIPESSDYSTVVGFLQGRTGRLLREGELVRYKDLTFAIEKTEGFKTLSIRVQSGVR